MLLAIEGIDASGKDTVVNALTESYGYVHAFNFPTYRLFDDAGKSVWNNIRFILKEYLKNPDSGIDHFSFQIFAFMDKYLASDKLSTCKKSKKKYIINRYISSSVVYGVASISKQEGIDLATTMRVIKNLNAYLVQPDVDVCLTADISVVKERLLSRGLEYSVYENDEYFQCIKDMYEFMYSSDNKTSPYPGTIPHMMISNNGDKLSSDVAKEIHEFVMSNIAKE